MATKLGIYNLALSRLGQNRLANLNDNVENRRKLDNIYDEILGQLLTSGPEKGWKFTKIMNVGVDREYATITAFTDYASIVTGTVLVTTKTAHNLVSGNDAEIGDTTNYDDTYTQITAVSPSQFYMTDTFVADDATGKVYWISDNYAYRYKIPADSERVVDVKVGGVELNDWIEEDGYIMTNQESDTVYMNYIKLVTNPALYPYYFVKVLYLTLAMELSFNIKKSSANTERLQNELDKAMSWAEGRDEQKQYVHEVSTSWVDAGRGSTEGRIINPNYRGDGYTS
jgi:hypothetical protein